MDDWMMRRGHIQYNTGKTGGSLRKKADGMGWDGMDGMEKVIGSLTLYLHLNVMNERCAASQSTYQSPFPLHLHIA
jgi:hypothetical protein